MKPTILLVAVGALSFGLHAQNVSAVGDFTIERVLTLASASAPNPPSFPPQVLSALQAGQIELHQVFKFESAKGTIDQLAFVVPANSPLPFPNPGSAPVGDHYVIQVDSSSVLSSPRSVVLIGHVISNDVDTPFGNNTGAGITISFGYQTTGSSVTFGPIMESVSPLYNLYTPTGKGSLSLTPAVHACSAATLNGTYMFRLGGSVHTTTFVPFWEVGTLTADGKGNLTVHDAGNIGGSVYVDRTFPIAYTVDATCHGKFNWSGASMDITVSKDGRNFDMVFTGPTAFIANGSGQIQ